MNSTLETAQFPEGAGTQCLLDSAVNLHCLEPRVSHEASTLG